MPARPVGAIPATRPPSAAAALRSSDADQEVVDLRPEPVRLMRELAGVIAHHLRRLPGLARRVRELADLFADEAGTLCDLLHVVRDLVRGRTLLLDGRRYGSRDVVD